MKHTSKSNEKVMEKEKQQEVAFEPLQDNESDIAGGKEGNTSEKKRSSWIAPVIILTLVGVLAGVYCGFAVYYRTHFFENTTINGVDCSHMEVMSVAAYLDEKALDYSIDIIGRDETGEEVSLGMLEAEAIGYAYADTLSAVTELLEQQNEWQWILSLGRQESSYSLVQGVTIDSDLLAEQLKKLDAFKAEKMIAPADAYISDYTEAIGGYEVIPEKAGTTFDVAQAITCVETAILGNATSINLVEQGCYEEAKITSDNKALTAAVETINQWLSTEIIYDWNGTEIVLDRSVIKDWVSFEENVPVFDEDAVKEFVRKNANKYDTSGKNTTFTTALGVEVTLPRLSYGWKTDRDSEVEELTALIKEGTKQNREPVYFRKGVVKGENDIGDSYVEADLTNQHLYVFEDGAIVFETDFVSGNMINPNNSSPAGIFGLTYKTLNAVLRGRDYETPVTYWMPFYGNYGLHDATWRNTFGGDIYLNDGSHGCLNLPFESAAVVYNYVYESSPIICYYY